jgi:formylglycine-generating enzyme required for sulfatase activity
MVFVRVPAARAFFCVWETRVQDFAAFAEATGRQAGNRLWGLGSGGWEERAGFSWRSPGFAQGPTHPVVGVDWEDAQAFCKWLTERERRSGQIGSLQRYRLPTDREWGYAARTGVGPGNDAGQVAVRAQGEALVRTGSQPGVSEELDGAEVGARRELQDHDGHRYTAPVGSFAPNVLGLFDLWGNVWEWCEDWYGPELNADELRQRIPFFNESVPQRAVRVIRGASWRDLRSEWMQNWLRFTESPTNRLSNVGFRVVLEPEPAAQPAKDHPVSGTEASRAVVRYTNSLGMIFVSVPGTAALFSAWETRVRDFGGFVEATGHNAGGQMRCFSAKGPRFWGEMTSWQNPPFPQGPEHPVVGVNWEDARAFCAWLTKHEQSAGRISQADCYRLPTDQEWSKAVGLGDEGSGWPADKDKQIPGRYPWGNQWPVPSGAGNYSDRAAARELLSVSKCWNSIPDYRDGFAFTAPVGSFQPNAFGLFDLGGNVEEWCQDWHDELKETRLLRGASWLHFSPDNLLSCRRHESPPDFRADFIGFRVVLEKGRH